jgi:2-oxoisovalerate dehydrogenase E1 component
MDRLDVLDARLVAALEALRRERPPDLHGGALARAMSRSEALALFDAQVRSRALDRAARRMRAAGAGYYTIASAGHERNAMLGMRLAPDDPCLLHYRSGALVLARAAKAGITSVTRDVLLSFRAAAADPIAGGRHKVWGSAALSVVPQTSTIASHLPKAVGLAFALSRARRVGRRPPFDPRAIVVCSFGDASANHATALAGVQAARYAHRRGHAMPILFVCEDNGLGISERQPAGWLEQGWRALPGLVYRRATGPLHAAWSAVGEAIDVCRTRRAPVLLHLDTVRLGGHAGSDAESAYLRASEIADMERRDPIVETAHALVAAGLVEAEALIALHADVEAEVAALERTVADAPPLGDTEEIERPLPPCRTAAGPPEPIHRVAGDGDATASRAGAIGDPAPLAAHLSDALGEVLETEPGAVIFGEDVGRKGGVYGITAGLQRRFGEARVFDTQLDETSILGAAQGLGIAGLLPIPEIQYLAYLHNAIDQLRGEACSLGFFSNGAFRNPMVVRIASFAYQKGFGGHFHNDNAVSALREIPGLLVAAPAVGDDAARMLHAAVRLARDEGRVVAFLEPIALYFERDLHAPGDGGWLRPLRAADVDLPPGRCGVYAPGGPGRPPDLVMVSHANGLRLALRAARRLAEREGLVVRVLDLRWLAPLPLADLLERVPSDVPCLVVDECRASGGVADAVVAHLAESGHRGGLASVRSRDCYVPLGPAADPILLGEGDVEAAAGALLERRAPARPGGG